MLWKLRQCHYSVFFSLYQMLWKLTQCHYSVVTSQWQMLWKLAQGHNSVVTSLLQMLWILKHLMDCYKQNHLNLFLSPILIIAIKTHSHNPYTILPFIDLYRCDQKPFQYKL